MLHAAIYIVRISYCYALQVPDSPDWSSLQPLDLAGANRAQAGAVGMALQAILTTGKSGPGLAKLQTLLRRLFFDLI